MRDNECTCNLLSCKIACAYDSIGINRGGIVCKYESKTNISRCSIKK